MTYKILKEHLVTGTLEPGHEIGIKIDQTLTQDATGTMAYLQFEAIGISAVKTELSVSYVDHNTLQMGFENADDHRYLQTVTSHYGIHHSRAGNGICHQIHLERFARPGATLLGSDSHTPTCGGIGMLSIGAGGLDVAVAMGGGAFYLTAPRIISVRLLGALRSWVSAKDIILHLLSILTTKGNVGTVVEYSGPGVESLTVPERSTITNMGAEIGVTTSLFPSDAMTRKFLVAQDRAHQWRELHSDENALYDKIIEIDLSSLEPLAACPHSPDNIKPIKSIQGKHIDQVAIGSCTNSSYRDLMIVSRILKDRKIAPHVSCIIAPGSRQVFEMISRNGALADIIASGARIMESACGFCIGAGQSPVSHGVSLRTNNRNFEGRSGTMDAGVYLVSPETAALSAVAGKLVDPLTIESSLYPTIELPERYIVDDSMILRPEGNSISIIRGPNIGAPPVTEPLQAILHGMIGIKVGDKITTDHIMPAGIRLKYRSNIEKYSEYVFESIDREFSHRARQNLSSGFYTAIVGGSSYGQGSSREHAAICPMYLGVRVVIAKSFERIHAANLVNFGILPLIFKNEADYDRIQSGQTFTIKQVIEQVSMGEMITVSIENHEIPCLLMVSERQRKILIDGGLLNHTKKDLH